MYTDYVETKMIVPSIKPICMNTIG